MLRNGEERTIVLDENGEVCLSLWNQKDEAHMIELLRKERGRVLDADSHKMFRNVGGSLYSITGRVIPYKGKRYTAFYCIESKIPIAKGKYGIRFCDKKEALELLSDSFYSMTGEMGGLKDSIEKISQSPFPVMIIGERGMEKEQIGLTLQYSFLSMFLLFASAIAFKPHDPLIGRVASDLLEDGSLMIDVYKRQMANCDTTQGTTARSHALPIVTKASTGTK